MNIKIDLEAQIRSSYKIIHDYEKIIQTTDRPEEKLRAQRQIEDQKKLLKEYFSQYVPLCQRSGVEMAQDIIEIAYAAGIIVPEIKKGAASSKPGRRKKPKVFISYARNDVSIASEVYSFLRENECSPWMDEYDLVPGQDWRLEIHRNIKESDYFIACLSNHSVSKVGYVQKELKEALSVLDEMPEGQIYLIPIKIDNCVMPFSLEKRHWLDWSTTNAKELLLRAVKTK